MFKKRFYLPMGDYYRWKWLVNFAAKLPALADKYGIPKETVDIIVANSAAFNYVMLYLDKIDTVESLFIKAKAEMAIGKDLDSNVFVNIPALIEFTEIRPAQVHPKIFDICMNVGDSILSNVKATPEDILTLKLVKPADSGIEIPEDRRKPATPPKEKPVINITVSGAKVMIEITRGKGLLNTNAILFANRGAGNIFTELGSTNGSTYEDIIAFPAGVERVTVTYQCQLKDKNNAILGKPSDPVTVTVQRPLGT